MQRRSMVCLGLVAILGIAGAMGHEAVGSRIGERTIHEWRTIQLAAAYPALRLDEEIAALLSASKGGQRAGGAAIAHHTSAQEWFDRPFGERWAIYTRPDHARVQLFTHLELAVFAAGIAAFLARTLGRGLWFLLMLRVMQRRARPGTSHGSAHWATGTELAALRPRPGHADLVVGRVGRHLVAIPERDQYEHLLLVAPTGAGKTSGVILPNLLAESGTRSLVVTDPKRELLRKSSLAIRARYGDGHVWVLDYLDPALSRGYNPLAYVTDAATADLFAQTWVRNTGESKDAFWSNAARTLIGAAALHLVATEEITPPLVALVDLLCSTPAEQVSAALRESPVPEVRRLAHGFLTNMAKNERLLGSVFTELPPRFTCLNLPEVRAVTGSNEIDFARLAQEPTALYLALDPQYSRTLAPLTACFFLHFFTTLTNIAKSVPSGALPVPVLAYLDEFGTVGHIPEFASRMATVRSAGIGCLLVVQDVAQLSKAYGEDDADTILSNATTKMCLGRVTHDDAEYFSKLAGTTTVYATNRSASRSLMVPWADRGNRGAGETQRALVTPDELRTMRDAVFVVAGHRHPIRAHQRRYYDDPALARRVPDLARSDPLVQLRRAGPLPVPMLDPPLTFTEEHAVSDEGDAPIHAVSGGEGVAIPVAVVPASTTHGLDRSGTAVTPQPHATAPLPAEDMPETAQATERTERRIALTPSQRRLLDALVTMPTANSSQLAAALGVQGSTVRDGLTRIRRALGIGPEDAIVGAARTCGVLPPAPPAAEPATVATDPIATRAEEG